MSLHRLRRLALFSGMIGLAACATPTPPGRMSYCTELHGLWYRYRTPVGHAHTAQQAPADYALYACQLGRYDEGIAILTDLLQRHKVAVPAPPPLSPLPR